MMSDWPIKPITELVEFNPVRKIKKGAIAPFVDMAALPTGAREVSDVGEREFKGSGSKFQNGDTLFARITPCLENGKTAKVTVLSKDEVAHGSTEFIVMAAKQKEYDEDFVYYIARLPEFRNYAQSRMEGTSGRQRVPWQALTTYELPIPPKEIRKQIGDILRSIDDKIELNRQINQTLEQIAQAIFKSWFVDFEPVKAKIAAKQNGQDPERAAMRAISGKTDEQLYQLSPDQRQQLAATAALFPDELVDSELGKIPKGWKPGSMKDCCLRVESGGTPKRSESTYWNGNIRWLSSREVRDVIVLDTKEKITEEGLHSSSAKVWPAGTTVIAMYGATAGQVCFLANRMAANQACCALIPKTNYQSYIFFSARRSIEDLSGKASGSAQQNLNKSLIDGYKVLLPEEGILKEYELVAFSLLKMWIRNTEQNQVLADLRNSLLPKLLYGEITLSDAQFVTETAV